MIPSIDVTARPRPTRSVVRCAYSCKTTATDVPTDRWGLNEPAVHRIAQPTLHQLTVGKLDGQRRLEPRRAAGELEIMEWRGRGRRPGHSRPLRNPAPSATERPQRTRPRATAEDICHHRAVPNFEGFVRSPTTTQSAPPPTQRSISGLHVEMTARRRARLSHWTRGNVDVGDGISDRTSVSDRTSSHEVDAVSPKQRGKHVDDIVVVLNHEQGPTGQFRKPCVVFMGLPGITHPNRRSRSLRSAIDMTWPFSTAASRARGRPSDASCSRSASTVLSMNVSTSRPIECASSSATTNARGLTQRAHRREFSYSIHRWVADAAPFRGASS